MISLRDEITALLPPGGFLRIDRTGNALYAAAIDDPTANALQANGWICTPAGRIYLLAPGLLHFDRLRPCACPSQQWRRFAALPTDSSLLPLLTALLRALEMPPNRPAYRKLEKQLRQATAIALRCHTGGGLELCETLFHAIKPL